MNETVLLWILGTLVTIIIGLSVAIYSHVKECRDTRLDIVVIKAQLALIAEHFKVER